MWRPAASHVGERADDPSVYFKGCKTDLAMGTHDLKVLANKAFKQAARDTEAAEAFAERDAAAQATRDKTERLKALRLEKEAAERLRKPSPRDP
jgi:hypothetical protein